MNSMLNRGLNHSRLFVLGAFILALALLQAPVHAADPDGKVIFLIGSAWVQKPDGGLVPITQGMGVVQGDTIVTAENGQVHVRTSDGGYIAIMPNSRFKIEAYKYTPQQGADKSGDVTYYQLIKGGFRSITGAIGHNNKKAYRVRTPVATIGIRGTDYTARLCDTSCTDVNGNPMQSGLYVGVWQGGITVANGGGSLDVSVNQFGYVANDTTTPVQRAPIAGNVLHAATGSATNTTVASTGSAGDVAMVGASQPTADVGTGQRAVSATNDVVALPTTGTATYTNTQNTSVTSTNVNGAAGATVTSATLNVNFGTMTASTTVNVDMTSEVLTVTANNMTVDPNTATFSTNTGVTVETTDKSTLVTQPVPGITSVSVNGQFTGDATATGPTGANMGVDIQAVDSSTGQQQSMQINSEMTKQ